MIDDPVLLSSIIADPDDDGLRLAYADWLQEHGQLDRARLVRVQIELANLPEPARAEELRQRETVLLAEYGLDWLGPLRRVVLGSATGEILEAVTCPVLVVPRRTADAVDDAIAPLAAATVRRGASDPAPQADVSAGASRRRA